MVHHGGESGLKNTSDSGCAQITYLLYLISFCICSESVSFWSCFTLTLQPFKRRRLAMQLPELALLHNFWRCCTRDEESNELSSIVE
jgi:hypothetical protein